MRYTRANREAWCLVLKWHWGEPVFWERKRLAEYGEKPTEAGYRERIAKLEAELAR